MSIAGVSVHFGNLAIVAPKAGGNAAVVSIDPSNHDVAVSLNGQSEEFAPSLITSITYEGGSGGGDTFTNNTSLVSLDYGYGGHNTFTGGGGANYVFFWGNDNTFNSAAGSLNDVFEDGGSGDRINGTGTVYVY